MLRRRGAAIDHTANRAVVTHIHSALGFKYGLHAVQGVLRMGQEIEVRPGIVTKDAEGRSKCLPIYSRIVSLKAEDNNLQYAVPGGLIGVGMTVRFSEFKAKYDSAYLAIYGLG